MKLSINPRPAAQFLPAEKLNSILPVYGTPALDVPHYDSDKHMYIVDQHTSLAGNRSVTYVAIGDQMVVEVVMGVFHCWTLMNTVRLLVFDGTSLNVVKTHEWKETTYYKLEDLRAMITNLVTRYVLDSLKMDGLSVGREIEEQAEALVGKVLEQGVDDHFRNDTVRVLKAYCRQMNLCRDYVTK